MKKSPLASTLPPVHFQGGSESARHTVLLQMVDADEKNKQLEGMGIKPSEGFGEAGREMKGVAASRPSVILLRASVIVWPPASTAQS